MLLPTSTSAFSRGFPGPMCLPVTAPSQPCLLEAVQSSENTPLPVTLGPLRSCAPGEARRQGKLSPGSGMCVKRAGDWEKRDLRPEARISDRDKRAAGAPAPHGVARRVAGRAHGGRARPGSRGDQGSPPGEAEVDELPAALPGDRRQSQI